MSRGAVLALILLCAGVAHAGPADFVLPSGDRVEGARLSDLEGMATQVERVRSAVRATYQIEIGTVPVHVVSLEDIRTLHREVGGRLPSGWQLHGFELDGHVFVRRGLGGVSDEVLIHECLHASSQRFASEAHARRVERLVEGVTQYLTLRALEARPRDAHLRAERNHTYVASTRLAETLATLVGDAQLRTAYFKDGFAALCARVNQIVGGKRRLVDAAALLDAGDEQAALARLTGRP